MSLAPAIDDWDDPSWLPGPTPEEVALAHELALLDRCEDEEREGEEPGPVVEPLTDAELLEAMTGRPSAVDLLLLESIDPMALPSKGAVLDYLRAAERVDAYAAALKARARVALAGVEPSGVLLAEVAVEHELAVATRSSQ